MNFCLFTNSPTGTGKSETGAHIAYIFARVLKQLKKTNQCIVYCAPSNKAVDVVHSKWCDKLILSCVILYNCSKKKKKQLKPRT